MKGQALGATIKALREARGMTQAQLASETRVAAQTISRWERNQDRPRIDEAVRLARALGVTLAFLVGEETHAPMGDRRHAEALRALIEVIAEFHARTHGGERWKTFTEVVRALVSQP